MIRILGTRMSWFKDDQGDFINKVDWDDWDNYRDQLPEDD